MNIIKYCVSFFVVFCCSYSEASNQEKIMDFSCPYVLSETTKLPVSWEVLGVFPSEKLQLRNIGVIDGNAAEEKQRLMLAKERIFSEDIIDEWEEFSGRSEAVAEYPETHSDKSLMCTYAKSLKESFDENLNVVLLIPLPSEKYVTCLLTRRDTDPTHEISCKSK